MSKTVTLTITLPDDLENEAPDSSSLDVGSIEGLEEALAVFAVMQRAAFELITKAADPETAEHALTLLHGEALKELRESKEG